MEAKSLQRTVFAIGVSGIGALLAITAHPVSAAKAAVDSAMPALVDAQRAMPEKPAVQAADASFSAVAQLMLEFPAGPSNFGHINGVSWDGTSFWTNDGGTTPSLLNRHDVDGTFLSSVEAPYDGRSIVQHPDSTLYAASFAGSFSLALAPYTSVLAGIFPDTQMSHAVLDNGNIIGQLNGMIYEYSFPSGAPVRTVALDPACPACTLYPNNSRVASDGEHVFTLSDDDVYVYDYPSGLLVAIVDLDMGNELDAFNTPWSLSYDDSPGDGGLLYVKTASNTLRGYRIDEGSGEIDMCDLDGSGGWTSADTLLFRQGCAAGTSEVECDLNDDGNFNVRDVAAYQRVCKV